MRRRVETVLWAVAALFMWSLLAGTVWFFLPLWKGVMS